MTRGDFMVKPTVNPLHKTGRRKIDLALGVSPEAINIPRFNFFENFWMISGMIFYLINSKMSYPSIYFSLPSLALYINRHLDTNLIVRGASRKNTQGRPSYWSQGEDTSSLLDH